MKFRLSDNEEHRLRITADIPFTYLPYVKRFAKPIFLKSEDIDIIYQERSALGCKLRYITFFIKHPLEILSKIGKPRMTFQTIDGQGDIGFVLDSGEVVRLTSSNFFLLHQNTEYHKIILTSSVSNLLRIDYGKEAFDEHTGYDLLSREIVNSYYSGSTKYYGQHGLSSEVGGILNELLPTVVENDFREHIFGLRLKQILTLGLEAHESIVS